METSEPPALTLDGVRRTYEAETAPVRALRGVDLVVGRGEFVALMGPSGCGKSTLLHIAAGLDRPDEGSVQLAGREITALSESRLSKVRRKDVGMVFQFFHLLESMSVAENIVAGRAGRRRLAGGTPTPARTSCSTCWACSTRPRSSPAGLSGGQRQRLAIARALANRPTLLLADEPTGALDSDGADEVLELFRRLHAAGQSILMVTHNPDVAAGAQRTVHLRDGVVAA